MPRGSLARVGLTMASPICLALCGLYMVACACVRVHASMYCRCALHRDREAGRGGAGGAVSLLRRPLILDSLIDSDYCEIAEI